MRVRIASKTALLILAFAPMLAVRSEGAFQEDRLADPQMIAEGSKLFAASCSNAYCHGKGGEGGIAPRLRGSNLTATFAFNAISNGLPNTSMPGFKDELSDDQIWKLVAFIVAESKTNPASPSVESPLTPSQVAANPAETIPSPLQGDAQAGKAIFFESARPKNCSACHSLKGEGGQIGPDLSDAANKSPRALFLSIVFAGEIKDARYSTITVGLKNGEKIVGVKKDEDVESIRVYDTTEMPAVLRTVQKANVVKVEQGNESVMPKDYASVYTIKQLLDLVAFLRSTKSKSPVTLKDMLE